MSGISIIDELFSWVEEKSKSPYYIYYLTCILVGLSLFLATPKYLFYIQNPELVADTWNAFVLKSKNLLDPLTQFNPNTHQAKLVFRLTVPVLVKALGLGYIAAYALKFILGVFLLVLIYKLSLRLLADNVSATFLTSGLAFLYFGRACFVAYPTFDGIAFFCTILALLYQRPLLIFFLCTVAAWVDERAFIALPIVLFFHQMRTGQLSDLGWKSLVKLKPSSTAVLAAIIGYSVLRFYLAITYNMHTPNSSANFSVMNHNLHMIGVGIWTFWEGFWLLYFLFVLYALRNKYYLLLSAVVMQTLVSGIVAGCVDDVTRSGSYLVPLVFIFIVFLKNYFSSDNMRHVLFICSLFSFAFPAYYVIARKLDMQHPIYYDALAFIFNRVF